MLLSMSTSKAATPPSRPIHPDPVTNRIVQDLYNKLNQVQAALDKKQDKS